MKLVKVGFIGLGNRGKSLLENVVLPQKKVEVNAVCDICEERRKLCAELVTKSGAKMPKMYSDYKDVINDDNVNTIIIATAWVNHTEIAIEAMKAGKAVGMEVGGSYSVDECWELVKTYEETKTPFMFMENCCFGRREMMVLNMVKKGVLGEIVHCSGGYHHDLREEMVVGYEKRQHYRLDDYLKRNCENYPTHELGPILKILNINHGNRMLTLTSTASKSAGLHEYIMKNSHDENLKTAEIRQGDIITTTIKCANGETIAITLDTTLPRYYSRGFTVRGTKGLYEESTDSVFLDREEDRKNDENWRKNCVNNAEMYESEYDHEVWKEYLKEGIRGDHGGMDWLEFSAFFNCLLNDLPMPVDVYDAACMMVITPLSEQSILRGGTVTDIPDFTRGKWMK